MDDRDPHCPDGKAITSVNVAVRRIAPAVFTVGALSALAKFVGALKVIYLASLFGTRDELDAYLIAFLLPSFVADLAGGALASALIPSFASVRERDGIAAVQRLSSNLLIATIVSLVFVSALLAAGAETVISLVASGFGPQKIELTKTLFYVLLPMLPMSGIGALWRAMLNAQGEFAVAAAAPILTPLITIAFAAVFASQWGVLSLAVGSTIGALIEASVLLLALRRGEVRPRLAWHAGDKATSETVRQLLPLVSASLVSGVGALVTQSLGARLPPGSVSTLNYANKAMSVILVVGPAAIGTAVLPHFSQLLARSEHGKAWSTFRLFSWLVLAVTIPATAILMYFSEPLVRLLYERGAFSPADTTLVAQAQSWYFLQLPAAMFTVLAFRLLTSLKANWKLFHASVLHLVTLAVASTMLMRNLGVEGLALASSVSMFCYAAFLLWILLRTNKGASSDA